MNVVGFRNILRIDQIKEYYHTYGPEKIDLHHHFIRGVPARLSTDPQTN